MARLFRPAPSKRAGKKKIPFNKEKTASNVIPTRRKGIEISHTSGNNNNATTANGQHSKKRKHHPKNMSMNLILVSKPATPPYCCNKISPAVR